MPEAEFDKDGAAAMAEELKETGNELFKLDKFDASIEAYTKALELQPNEKVRLTLYKNRAMARLKLEDFEGAEADCDKALELNPSDPKAHYRRALAREKLNKIGTAFTDAKEALRLQPGDKVLVELCTRLVKANSQKLKQVESMESRVNEMMKLSFDESHAHQQCDKEKHVKAMNNLLVLCRDSNEGALRVWRDGAIVGKLLDVLKGREKYADEVALCAVRILSELAKSRERAEKIMELLGGASVVARIPAFRQSEVYLEAASTVVQHIFNGLAAMDRAKDIKPDEDVVERNKLGIVRLILELEEMLTDSQYSAPVREMAIDILMKNLMHMDGGLPRGWSWRFVEDRGLYKMLHIATQMPEQCEYPVSAETRQHVAIFLTRLYDDMVFDQRRALYTERVKEVFGGLLSDIGAPQNRVKLAAILITLLQGPVDVGVNLITNDQVTAIMLQMATSDDRLEQSLAAELIVLSVSKYERATALIKQGLPVLKKLYQSDDPNVRVRALVGLCKCASSAGDDCSRQPMDDESRTKLAATCRKFLIEAAQKYSVDIRRFACEGLSYLSLDAEIKEYIVSDLALLKALVELAKSAGALCVYTMAAIFMNCANAYDKPKIDEEMVKLAQYAKHHVPETHPKDTDEFVEKRVRRMVQAGAVTACVSVSKTESRNALDNLAKCMRAFSALGDLSGQIISEGGVKLLLHLYKECTGEGMLKAAHALARLGAFSDPNIAFAGQRMYEVVKPMVELLHPDVDGRANYDALLTLTNLASVNDSVRKRIVKERALPKIEEFWFDPSQAELRAAAAELLLNLLYCEDYFREVVRPGTDRAKCWVLWCADEEADERLKLASSAGFAILSEDKQFCEKILRELSDWAGTLKEMAMAEHPEVQRRCLIGLANMVELGGESVASQIIGSEIFRILVAITKLENKERERGQKEAQRALDAAEKAGLIKATERQMYERTNKLSTVPENP